MLFRCATHIQIYSICTAAILASTVGTEAGRMKATVRIIWDKQSHIRLLYNVRHYFCSFHNHNRSCESAFGRHRQSYFNTGSTMSSALAKVFVDMNADA